MIEDQNLLEVLKKIINVPKAEEIPPKKEKKTRKRVFTEEQKQKFRVQLIKARDRKKQKKGCFFRYYYK